MLNLLEAACVLTYEDVKRLRLALKDLSKILGADKYYLWLQEKGILDLYGELGDILHREENRG